MTVVEKEKRIFHAQQKEALYRKEVKMVKRRLKCAPVWDYLKCNSLELLKSSKGKWRKM